MVTARTGFLLPPNGGDGPARPDPLIQEFDVRVDRRALARRGIVDAIAEMDQADEPLAVGEADRRTARRGQQDAGRPPVAGEASRLRPEEDGVDRACGGVEILLVLE